MPTSQVFVEAYIEPRPQFWVYIGELNLFRFAFVSDITDNQSKLQIFYTALSSYTFKGDGMDASIRDKIEFLEIEIFLQSRFLERAKKNCAACVTDDIRVMDSHVKGLKKKLKEYNRE